MAASSAISSRSAVYTSRSPATATVRRSPSGSWAVTEKPLMRRDYPGCGAGTASAEVALQPGHEQRVDLVGLLLLQPVAGVRDDVLLHLRQELLHAVGGPA